MLSIESLEVLTNYNTGIFWS